MVFEFLFEGERYKVEADRERVALFQEVKHSPREVRSGDSRWTEHEKRWLSMVVPPLLSELVVQLGAQDVVPGLAKVMQDLTETEGRLRGAQALVDDQYKQIAQLMEQRNKAQDECFRLRLEINEVDCVLQNRLALDPIPKRLDKILRALDEALKSDRRARLVEVCEKRIAELEEKIKGLEEAPAVPERGWMIENLAGVRPCWWTGVKARPWSMESLDGVRFARKEDAEAVMKYEEVGVGANTAVEHMWG